MQERKTRKIALSGIIIAIIIICLFGGSIVRNNKVFFAAFAIIISAVPYILGGIKYGITAYAASAILAFVLVPNKLYVGVYAVFGIYPLIKLFAERYNLFSQYSLKYLWFNFSLLITYYIYKNFIFVNSFFSSTSGIIILVLAAEILFFGFDYFFNLCIGYILRRLKGVGRNGY